MDKIKEALMPLKRFADQNMELTYTFAAIGACYAGYRLGQDIYGMYKYGIRPGRNLLKRYGNGWAIVTGASDGIGKGLALELARRGFKVGLVARNQEKLDAVAKEITDSFNVETKVVAFDFNVHYTPEVIKELTEKLNVFDKVSLLVNNVGMVNYGLFHEMNDENIHKQINVNVTGTTVMTKIILPKLLENERAGLLFIGSEAYSKPCEKLAIYSATKSFVYQFGRSIAEEYKDKLDITVVNTSSVKTNMNSGRYLFTITPEQHAKHALDKLGYDTITHGHSTHAMGSYFKNKAFEGSVINFINGQRRKKFEEELRLKREAEKQQEQ